MLSLDHVVIAVENLPKVMEDYKTLGFTVIEGGEHPGRGSRNVLVVFADGAYLELIAFDKKVEDFRWWQVLNRSGQGFVDFALLPGDIDQVVAAAQKKGLAMASPEDGGRLRPDGERLIWKTARTVDSDVPFLCGDVTPRALRVQEGDVRRHPNGVTGIRQLDIAVKDLSVSSKRYEALLGVAPLLSKPGEVHFHCGSSLFVLRDSSSADIRRHLDARGEGPCALTFSGPSAISHLDPALTHGASMQVAV